MPEQTSDESEPPRQGLTYLRVLWLAMALRDERPLSLTDEELDELCRAWLRLTDIAPGWEQDNG